MLVTLLSFVMSPWGKKILAVLAILAVLYAGVKSIQHTAFVQGQMEGQRTAWVKAEETNLQQWADFQKKLNAQQVAANAQVEAVRKTYENFMQKQQQVIVAIQQNQRAFDVKHEELAPAVEAALPDTPEPVKQELELFRQEVGSLRLDLAKTTGLLAEVEKISQLKDAAHNQIVISLEAQIEQVEGERDFYKAAFHESAPKKGCGWFKRIITLNQCSH